MSALASPKSLPHITATRGLSFQPRGSSEEAKTLACPFGKVANFALARFSQSFLTCVLSEMSARGEIILRPTQGARARAHASTNKTRLLLMFIEHLLCTVHCAKHLDTFIES